MKNVIDGKTIQPLHDGRILTLELKLKTSHCKSGYRFADREEFMEMTLRAEPRLVCFPKGLSTVIKDLVLVSQKGAEFEDFVAWGKKVGLTPSLPDVSRAVAAEYPDLPKILGCEVLDLVSTTEGFTFGKRVIGIRDSANQFKCARTITVDQPCFFCVRIDATWRGRLHPTTEFCSYWNNFRWNDWCVFETGTRLS